METNSKRILYFIPEFPRLTETFIEREVSWLIERGNLDVQIFSLFRASGQTQDLVLNKTTFKRLSVKYFILGIGYFLKKREQTLTALRIILRDSSKSYFSRIYLFLKSLGYTRFFEEAKPDHVHAHFLSDPSTVVLVSSIILNVPFSVSGHAKDVLVEGTLIREKIEYSKFIAVCNTFAYKKCIEVGGQENKDKVHLIYHGIDPVKFLNKTCSVEKIQNEKLYILTVARLVEKKGLQYLIEASEILSNQGLDHEIHIVGGPGDLYNSLTESISQKELENKVTIEGGGSGVDHDNVIEMYKKADIFVLPSIETGTGDVDGVPNVIVEAALSKVPVITTDAGGIKDLIIHEETGLLVEQKDPQAIATQIYKLYSNADLRKKLSENAYNKAVEMFNIENNVGEMERLFLI